MKRISTFALLLVLSILSGCVSSPPLNLNYAPSSTVIVPAGVVNVGEFTYLPGERSDILPNQIPNTALGSILFDQNVDDFFESALRVESRFIGHQLSPSGKVLSGTIIEFLIDDFGYSIDWTLEVQYSLEDCYEEAKKVQKNTVKFGDFFGILNGVIRENIDLLMSDPSFQACLSDNDPSLVGSNPVVEKLSTDSGPQQAALQLVTDQAPDSGSVFSEYPQLVSGLRSTNIVTMRNAAKKIGETPITLDAGLVLASIEVLETALKSPSAKLDKMYMDGLAWSAINLGNSNDKSAAPILVEVIASELPKKVRNAAIHGLKSLNGQLD